MRRFDILCKVIKETVGSPKFGCEVGVWKGQTSNRLLRKNKELTLLMVDPYQTYDSGRTRGPVSGNSKNQVAIHSAMVGACIQTAFAKDRRIVMVSESVTVSKVVAEHSLDFIYIDGDHSYQGVKNDIESWYPKIRPGGLVSGHDYSGTFFGELSVKRAVDEFAKSHDYTINHPVDDNMTWWFLKR